MTLEPMLTATPIDAIFALNLSRLMGNNHSVASLARDVNVHRTQVHRFLSGKAFPKPDVLERLCHFFEVDARILTHLLEDTSRQDIGIIPNYLTEGFDPVPQSILADGFYEEWRELRSFEATHMIYLLHIKTVGGVRQTKVYQPDFTVDDEGKLRKISGNQIYRGIAVSQAGGLAILERPMHHTGLTFTALRAGTYGDDGLFSGHKCSVQGVADRHHLLKPPVVLRRIQNGFEGAIALRRRGRFQTADHTPELVRWLLREQQNKLDLS